MKESGGGLRAGNISGKRKRGGKVAGFVWNVWKNGPWTECWTRECGGPEEPRRKSAVRSLKGGHSGRWKECKYQKIRRLSERRSQKSKV